MNAPNHEVVFENWRLQRHQIQQQINPENNNVRFRLFRSIPKRSFCTQHQKRGEEVPKKKWLIIILHNTEQLQRSNGRDQLILFEKKNDDKVFSSSNNGMRLSLAVSYCGYPYDTHGMSSQG